jgi:hypothetical protein
LCHAQEQDLINSYLLSWTITLIAILNCSCAYASNKTGVIDLLSEGEISFGLSYSMMNTALLSGATPSTINTGVATAPLSGSISQKSLLASLNFGVTDKTNVRISHGLQKTLQEFDYTITPDNYVDTSKWEGTTDPEICIQYLLADKNNSVFGATIYGAISPAATPSNSTAPEIMTNGAMTSKGVNGGAGNGYTTTRIGSTISFPVYVGYAFYNFEYQYGFVTSLTSQHGTSAELTFGYEHYFGNSVTIRPYVRASAIGSSFNGRDQSASYSKYDVGAYVITDISPRFSFELFGQYSLYNNEVIYEANGNTLTLSTSGYKFGLQGIYFFHK